MSSTHIISSINSNFTYLFKKNFVDLFNQAKYLEEAVDCFISIIAANETILTKISEGIKVEDVMKELTNQQEVMVGSKKQVGVFNLRLVFDNKERMVTFTRDLFKH